MSERLSSSSVPQTDRIERVLEYAVLSHHQHHALRELLYRGRDALYYRSAARILGLMDASGQPTERAVAFSESGEELLELLRQCLEESAVCRAWAQWAAAPSLWTVDAETAPAFLSEAAKLSPATIQRRAKTLQAWFNELRPEDFGVSALPNLEVERPWAARAPSTPAPTATATSSVAKTAPRTPSPSTARASAAWPTAR